MKIAFPNTTFSFMSAWFLVSLALQSTADSHASRNIWAPATSEKVNDGKGRVLLQQNNQAAGQVCTQTEYYCGAGDVFLGPAHNALNTADSCIFDKGTVFRVTNEAALTIQIVS